MFKLISILLWILYFPAMVWFLFMWWRLAIWWYTTIWTVVFIIFLVLIYKIDHVKRIATKLRYALIIFLITIISVTTYYSFNKREFFDLIPKFLIYSDFKWEYITNMDRYLKYHEKIRDNHLYKYKKIDDIIKAIKYIDTRYHEQSLLWDAYLSAEEIWLEKALITYPDEWFQNLVMMENVCWETFTSKFNFRKNIIEVVSKKPWSQKMKEKADFILEYVNSEPFKKREYNYSYSDLCSDLFRTKIIN